MVVTCPACTARYKLDDSKIKGRGARITCPKCGHKFVVYKDQDGAKKQTAPKPAAKPVGPQAPPDLPNRDFSRVGITFTIRKSIGLTYDLSSMADLERFRADGRVEAGDEISWDRQTWTDLNALDDEEAWFWDVWQRAERGEIRSKMQIGRMEEEEDEEDDEDAPTSIIGTGSNLADEIRKAVQDQGSARPATPPGAVARQEQYQNETTARRGGEEAVIADRPTSEGAKAQPKAPSPPKAPPKPAPSAEGGMSSTMMVGLAVLALVILVGLLFASGTLGG